MKKYNIVFLFILLLFLGLSKNINISTKDKTSNNTSNVASNVTGGKDVTVPYISDDLISITDDGTITNINITTETEVYIPSTVTKNGKEITVKILDSGTTSTGIFGQKYGSTPIKQNTVHYVYIPNTVTKIGQSAFIDCAKLVEVVIPESVTTIDYSAFAECDVLSKVYILGDITIFPSWIFNSSNNLLNVYYFGSGIVNWSSQSNRTKPLNIYFSNANAYNISKNSLLNQSFASSYNLSTDYRYQYSKDDKLVYDTTSQSIVKSTISEISDVVVPNSINGSNIIKIGVDSCSYNKLIKNVIISDGIIEISSGTSLEHGAFIRSRNIVNVYLPTTLTTIGDYAFTDCYATYYTDGKINTLPNITTLGSWAFSGGLYQDSRNIYLGNKLTSIGSTAFAYSDGVILNINSTIKSILSDVFWNTPNFTFLFLSKDVYNSNTTIRATYESYCTYNVYVQYINTGLFNNPTFKLDFQKKLDTHKVLDTNSTVNTYIYNAGKTLDMPELADFNITNVDTLKMYTAYNNGVYSTEVSKTGNASTILAKGTVGDTLTIYCNLYTSPSAKSLEENYKVYAFNGNNQAISNLDFNIDDINLKSTDNKKINLRFTNDASTGITGLPVVGYTYIYNWYMQTDFSSSYSLISNNNDMEPSTLTLRPESGADLNTSYLCTIIVTDTSGKQIAKVSKNIKLQYTTEKIDININNQLVSNINAISSVYGTDYTASINGVALSEDEMNEYFEVNYGLVAKSNNSNIQISFIGSLKSKYSSTFEVNTLQTGILTTKTNSTNLILISVTSGLFVVEVIVFMVVIFKQRSRG